MDLTEVYKLAKAHADYIEFRGAIDKIINNVPESAISLNEFELVVKNLTIPDVRLSLIGELINELQNCRTYFELALERSDPLSPIKAGLKGVKKVLDNEA